MPTGSRWWVDQPKAPQPWCCPEARLWCNVILVALADAQRNPADPRTQQARTYLASPPAWVLHFACGIDPDFWREKCVPALREKWAIADARNDPIWFHLRGLRAHATRLRRRQAAAAAVA